MTAWIGRVGLAWLALVGVTLARAEAAERFVVAAPGGARGYVVETPTGRGPLPAVLVLHGGGGDAERALGHYRWDRKARAAGLLAVAPEAMPMHPERHASFLRNPRIWNDGSGRAPQGRRQVDDVAYLRAVLDDLARRFPVDPARVYATGFSSGGSMAWRLGIDLGDRLAAIAPVAGYLAHRARPRRPVSVLVVSGADDPLNPMAGGRVTTPWGAFTKPPVRDSPARWAQALGCEAAPGDRALTPGVTESRWPRCRAGAEVVLVVVDGLGHHWAGGEPSAMPERLVGPYSDRIDATSLIWTFFGRHRRP